jgi:hypothetical protein
MRRKLRAIPPRLGLLIFVSLSQLLERGLMVAFGTIHDWCPDRGSVVSWHASPAACAIAGKARRNATPPSYQQAQHLRVFIEHAAAGLDMARLCFGTWDIPGICDVTAMTQAINAHIRRHDTYHSWFEFDDGEIVRRTIDEPGLIEFLPTEYGEMAAPQIRAHLLGTTPDPVVWNCFTFGIIQRHDHFTVYMSVDHLVTDGMSAGVIFLELHMMYAALRQGSSLCLPEPGSHLDYCARERDYTSALTLQSPQVGEWIRFAGLGDGTLPDFCLPLGDRSVPSLGAMMVVPLMDDAQAQRFEAACRHAGARFSGGVFACAALAEHQLTGTEIYRALTPYDTRSTPAEYLTPGWFASFIPVTAPEGNMSFGEVARAAQMSFDSAKELAYVPFHRVLELTSQDSARTAPAQIGPGERAVPLLSFIDARKVALTDQWDSLNVGIYGDSRLSDQVCVWINRFEKQTSLTISFPDNPIARDSVARYVDALTSVYAHVAELHSAEVP